MKLWKKQDWREEKYSWLPPPWELKLCMGKPAAICCQKANIRLFKWKMTKFSSVAKDQPETWPFKVWPRLMNKLTSSVNWRVPIWWVCLWKPHWLSIKKYIHCQWWPSAWRKAQEWSLASPVTHLTIGWQSQIWEKKLHWDKNTDWPKKWSTSNQSKSSTFQLMETYPPWKSAKTWKLRVKTTELCWIKQRMNVIRKDSMRAQWSLETTRV